MFLYFSVLVLIVTMLVVTITPRYSRTMELFTVPIQIDGWYFKKSNTELLVGQNITPYKK